MEFLIAHFFAVKKLLVFAEPVPYGVVISAARAMRLAGSWKPIAVAEKKMGTCGKNTGTYPGIYGRIIW